MAKSLSPWASHANTRRVELDSSLVPVMYLSSIPPSASDLAAASAKETADGWPAEMIARNHTRRQKPWTLTVGTQGLSLGDWFHDDISPNASGIRKFKPPIGRSHQYKWSGDSSVADKLLAPLIAQLATGEGAWGFVANMMRISGMDYVSSTVGNAFDGYSAAPQTITEINNNAPFHETDEFMWVGVSASFSSTDRWAVIKVKKNGQWPGIRGFVIHPNYASSSYENIIDESLMGWSIGRLWVDNGMKSYLQRLFPSTTFIDVNYANYASYPHPNPGNTNTAWNTTYICSCGTNPTEQVTWWGATRSLYEKRVGIWQKTVYAIGNPEFVNIFTVRCAWDAATDPTQGTAKGTHTFLGFEWAGARLGEMSKDMSAADKASLAELTICTVTRQVAPSTVHSLDDLSAAQAYKENGENIRDITFVPANAEKGTPKLTFQQVSAKVKDVDARVWHSQMMGDSRPFEATSVEISGNSSSVTVLSRLGNTVISNDPDFGLMALVSGALLIVKNYSDPLNPDACTAAFGFSYNEILNQTDALKTRVEFDESLAYGSGLPDLEKLTARSSARTAMILSQAALSRRQFASFVIGACTMAANARRVLI